MHEMLNKYKAEELYCEKGNLFFKVGRAKTVMLLESAAKGIDGRILKVREAYKGLNVLLQSAGAIVMKKALCILILI